MTKIRGSKKETNIHTTDNGDMPNWIFSYKQWHESSTFHTVARLCNNVRRKLLTNINLFRLSLNCVNFSIVYCEGRYRQKIELVRWSHFCKLWMWFLCQFQSLLGYFELDYHLSTSFTISQYIQVMASNTSNCQVMTMLYGKFGNTKDSVCDVLI